MAWFKVDDGFHHSAKVLSIPRAIRAEALGAWILGGTWSADNMTDGFIPCPVLLDWPVSEEAVQALVDAGLWDRVEGGIQFHDWCEYQPTREQLEAKAKVRSEVGALGGQRSGEARRSKAEANANLIEANAKQIEANANQMRTESNPEPEPVPKEPLLSDSGESDDGRFPDEVYAICNKLADYIRANGSKVGTVGPEWWKAADRLIRLDGHDLELIYQVMEWCQRDEFWQGNIRSMPKFRQQFDQLRIRMGNSKPKVVETAGYAPGVVTRRKKGEGVMYAVDAIDWDGSDDWKPSE
jgi:hypothetical protein